MSLSLELGRGLQVLLISADQEYSSYSVSSHTEDRVPTAILESPGPVYSLYPVPITQSLGLLVSEVNQMAPPRTLHLGAALDRWGAH